jgi:hypothetical protein
VEDEIPANYWAGIRYLVDRVQTEPAPGLVIEVTHPLAAHAVTKLAVMLGLISVAGSTDGRFYILQPADQSEAA